MYLYIYDHQNAQWKAKNLHVKLLHMNKISYVLQHSHNISIYDSLDLARENNILRGKSDFYLNNQSSHFCNEAPRCFQTVGVPRTTDLLS